MLGMRKSLLFTLAVALITVSLSKQDCASCCHGKWIACFTGCQTMKACASQCNTGLEICQNGCPGSCSVYDPPSFHKQNLVPGTRSNNRPQNLKMKKKLNKLLKKLQRKSGSYWRNGWTLLTWKAACPNSSSEDCVYPCAQRLASLAIAVFTDQRELNYETPSWPRLTRYNNGS